MRTPKEYTDNIKKGIITKDMLSNCLYSVNKRAKNYRDNARLSRCYGKWFYADNADKKKEEFYKYKDIMLSILTPDCIHTVERQRRTRIYDYEDVYEDVCNSNLVIYSNYYFDENDNCISFVDIRETITEYFLFYDMDFCSFHHPIDEEEVNSYRSKYNLNIKDIGDLITNGAECKDLIAPQCVKKVIALIQSGEYRYIS